MNHQLKTWQQTAQWLGAEFRYADDREDQLRQETLMLQVVHRGRSIRLSSRRVHTGKVGKEKSPGETRMTCAVVNPSGFSFNIFEQQLKRRLFKIIGLQDIPLLDPDLDRRYIVQANREGHIRELLHLPLVRSVFASPHVEHLQLAAAPGEWLSELSSELSVQPETFLLSGQLDRLLATKEELMDHFQLFAATLDGLDELNLLH